MKKFLLSLTLLLGTTAAVYATDIIQNPACQHNCASKNAITIGTPPPIEEDHPIIEAPVAPPLGWVSARFVDCYGGGCYISVRPPVGGVNVRHTPGGMVFLSLTNGVPVIILNQVGNWFLIAVACNLGPTGLWSDTAGVPLDTCQ